MSYTETAQDVLVALPATPTAARMGRRALHEAGLPEDLEHTAGLLATEVIANALRHSGISPTGQIILSAHIVGDFVRVEVTDPGPGFDPELRHEAKGFGLRLVDKLASRWGVETETENGTVVWFEVDRRRRRFDRD